MPRGRPKTKHLGKGRSGPGHVDRKPIRPLERQRMRPWLINLLDENTCDQLRWLNKPEKTFKISWKHAAGQTFDPTADATLFERWARHTGKYYTGDQPDPKKWKANFRCAMHSLPDVEEDKSLGVRRGNNAFRVYRFLEEKRARKPAAYVKRERDDRTSDEDEEEYEKHYIVRNMGTKSRPKKTDYDDFDSEGSETGHSPRSDHSDWTLTNEDLRRQDHETEDRSPLPNFEELCQTTVLVPSAFRKQKRVPDVPAIKQEYMDPYEEHQYTIILEDTREEDGYEQEMELQVLRMVTEHDMIQLDEQEMNEAVSGLDQEFWNTMPDCGLDLQEEVVISGNEGPSVIVQTEQESRDYMYTSIQDL